MKLASHIHTLYSPDCDVEIDAIVNALSRKNFDACILCDHDVFGLRKNDELFFSEAGIKVFRGIEFTCKEGIHIIGVADNIKELERPPFYYEALQLCHLLKDFNALIIVPHPEHATGVLGGRLKKATIKELLDLADFFESKSFKYGGSKRYRNIPSIGGDDAHYVKDIGNVYNVVEDDYRLKVVKVKTTWRYFLRRLMLYTISSKAFSSLRNLRWVKKILKYVKIFIKKIGIDSSL